MEAIKDIEECENMSMGATTLSITTLSLITFSIRTLSITTLTIITFSIRTLSITTHFFVVILCSIFLIVMLNVSFFFLLC
jgi:hypothetical protein